MQAVREAEQPGGPETMQVSAVPEPDLGAGDVRIRVRGAGINRADVIQRHGKYPVPEGASDVFGLEVSGTVAELGAEAGDRFAVGQEVVALLASGGYAEQVVVDHRQVLPAPDGVDLLVAGGIPEVATTVYSNLFMECGLDPRGPRSGSQAVLVHGGTGGIGACAVQLSRALGYDVLTTVGSPEKAQWVRDMGRRQDNALRSAGRTPGGLEVIEYRRQDFAEEVREKTGGTGVAAVLDVVGGAYLKKNIASVAMDGRIAVIAVQGGATAEISLAQLMGKRVGVVGTALRGRSVEAKQEILAGVERTLWPLYAEGLVDPLLDRTFPLEQVRAAHEYFDSGEHRGKVVLEVA